MRNRGLGRREFLQTMAAAAALAACRGGDDEKGAGTRVPRDPNVLKGRTCLVTGATSGMGAVTARELARLGATVIVGGRDAKRCAAHADAIRRETGARVETAVADLASLEQVRALARDVARRFDRLDVLVNNAATILYERTLTVDGLEKTFAVNYLSHFLLTNLLLDRVRASPAGRIVNVSSVQHVGNRIALDDLQGERHYERLEAYGRSKLAVLMFSYELARRLEGSSVTVNAVHPGTVRSDLGDENGLVRGWLRTKVRNLYRRASWMSAEEGAANIVRVASAPELAGISGRYFDQDREARSSPESYDEGVARRLWDVSAELCGLPLDRAASPSAPVLKPARADQGR